jgi:hypothetical protein
MTPEAALALQIARYREMTGEERMAIGFRLHELSCELARNGIRFQNPRISEMEVERELRRRIALAHEI